MNSNTGSPSSGSYFTTKTVCTGVATTAATTVIITPAGTGAVLQYCIKGKAYNMAAATFATPTVDIVTGAAFLPLLANKGCVFVLAMDAGVTTMRAAQGPIVDITSSSFSGGSRSEFPVMPDTLAPFAYIVAKQSSAGTTWTFGSANWNQAELTCAVVDVLTLPGRPQAS